MDTGTILVGDAGGTNVRFALAQVDGGRVSVSSIWKRPGADFATFSGALEAFLAETKPKPAGAAFGFAGAVRNGQVDLLNRSWSVDGRDLKAQLRLDRVVMVNDFFAMARSAAELGADDVAEIAQGHADTQGNVAVGGPGTGFGVSVLRRLRDGWVVVAGEGGHQAFAPQTEVDWRVAERLRARGVYVSNEIIAAGVGFDQTRAALAEVMGVPDPKLPQAGIIAAAETGDAFAVEFCRLRANTVMTAMGNTTLAADATGGVYLAGGVSQRLAPWLREKSALDRFYNRGPRTRLLRPIAIRLITTEAAPLIGAAHLWLDEANRGWL
jgi:glucokinase